jgi:hypothetical protein
LASYVFGKVANSVFSLTDDLGTFVAGKRTTAKGKGENKPDDPTMFQLLSKIIGESRPIKLFAIGFPFLLKKSRLFEYYVAHNAASLFYLSTGLLFIVAAAVPGDGNFRWAEVAFGVILLACGLKSEAEVRMSWLDSSESRPTPMPQV